MPLPDYQDFSPTTFWPTARPRTGHGPRRPAAVDRDARVAGPGVHGALSARDNLMLHAAIYRAEPGSVIVVESGDLDYALAGGNVCAVAQRRGIAAFVLDGVIRDLGEVREAGFPVFARGVIPIPGAKKAVPRSASRSAAVGYVARATRGGRRGGHRGHPGRPGRGTGRGAGEARERPVRHSTTGRRRTGPGSRSCSAARPTRADYDRPNWSRFGTEDETAATPARSRS